MVGIVAGRVSVRSTLVGKLVVRRNALGAQRGTAFIAILYKKNDKSVSFLEGRVFIRKLGH